jgi:hypothetical protein
MVKTWLELCLEWKGGSEDKMKGQSSPPPPGTPKWAWICWYLHSVLVVNKTKKNKKQSKAEQNKKNQSFHELPQSQAF